MMSPLLKIAPSYLEGKINAVQQCCFLFPLENKITVKFPDMKTFFFFPMGSIVINNLAASQPASENDCRQICLHIHQQVALVSHDWQNQELLSIST